MIAGRYRRSSSCSDRLCSCNGSLAAALLPGTCTLRGRLKLGNDFLKQGF